MDAVLITAATQRTLTEAFGPFVDADTLSTLLDRVADVPYPGDLERYAALVADVAKATLQPFIDRATAEHANWRATQRACTARARAFEEFWHAKTSPTIH